MDRDIRLRKVCPQCNTVVHMKRSCCGCGHVVDVVMCLLLWLD